MISVHCYNRQRVFRNRDTYPIMTETAEHVLYHSPSILGLLEDGIGVSIDITLVGPRTMRRINREQRRIDAETDVLSFPNLMMHRGIFQEHIEEWQIVDFDGSGRRTLDLGELIISPGRVASQAQELGHSFDRELRFLVIHGVLHLLGYDHEEEDDELEMIRLQKSLLADLDEIPCGFVALVGRPMSESQRYLTKSPDGHLRSRRRNLRRCVILFDQFTRRTTVRLPLSIRPVFIVLGQVSGGR